MDYSRELPIFLHLFNEINTLFNESLFKSFYTKSAGFCQ